MQYTIIALIAYFLFIEVRKSPEKILTIQLTILFVACCTSVLINNYYLWFALGIPAIFVYATTVHKWYKQRIYDGLQYEYKNKMIDINYITTGVNSLFKSNMANVSAVFMAAIFIGIGTKYPDTGIFGKNSVILFLKCFALYALIQGWTFSVAMLRAYRQFLKEISTT
jgi:hypothetical protein